MDVCEPDTFNEGRGREMLSVLVGRGRSGKEEVSGPPHKCCCRKLGKPVCGSCLSEKVDLIC